MARDTSQVKKNTTRKSITNDEEVDRSAPSNADQNNTRGWKDVFDNCTYSSGPGDNIYVFG
jgi:hypothetical protein